MLVLSPLVILGLHRAGRLTPSLKLCSKVFPVAAGDVFFETPALSLLSAQVLNALPMWRKTAAPTPWPSSKSGSPWSPAATSFSRSARSRDGTLKPFKAGLGMIVAGTPVPVVPCWITGAMEAWHPESRWPRPRKVGLRIGPSSALRRGSNSRAGWEQVAREAEEAVRGWVALAFEASGMTVDASHGTKTPQSFVQEISDGSVAMTVRSTGASRADTLIRDGVEFKRA